MFRDLVNLNECHMILGAFCAMKLILVLDLSLELQNASITIWNQLYIYFQISLNSLKFHWNMFNKVLFFLFCFKVRTENIKVLDYPSVRQVQIVTDVTEILVGIEVGDKDVIIVILEIDTDLPRTKSEHDSPVNVRWTSRYLSCIFPFQYPFWIHSVQLLSSLNPKPSQ